MFALAPLAPVAAALVAWIVIRASLRSPFAQRFFADLPGPRSLHSQPVPRTGGLGIGAGIAVAVAMLRYDLFVFALALALALVSLLDDWRGVPVAVRLVAHLAAGLALIAHFVPPWPWWFSAIVVLAVAWMTNLYNFMDGSDGLAGGMTLIGFGAYALAAYSGGAVALALSAASIAAAAAAFLLFNFHPARVFMGDAGSIPLGFLAAALGFAGFVSYVWPVWFPVLVFSPFILDASVTVARRLAKGERVWQPHKTHYYQRMVQIGWGHRRVALGGYAAMAACAAVALLAISVDPRLQLALLAGVAVVYAAVAVWFEQRWSRHLSLVAAR